MLGHIPTDTEWQAIVEKDESFDGKLIYADTSTKICCHPSCKSKTPDRQNVRVYKLLEQAMELGNKPCKRCKPGGIKISDVEWTDQMNRYMDQNYTEHITLQLLADEFHGSPYHLQRVYKQTKGYTPTEYLQKLRIEHAITLLKETYATVEEVGHRIGLHNTSYFITLFKKITGSTPKQYKKIVEGR
ncbi:MAG: methylphosphotriester-DNA--protein-cysteine methyltransferase family protein [Kurthia sp.]|nr:methylphosphotriester-DNA--protein-cysteine methyltransferase family protein [Candidatus Kurthia equi]